ncbi:hypothetical protein LCGC14_1463750 [marine sediment metagenome]|uniref:Uncharacterized protein n=1 Tax=marine sediment metagenome TaxID=412755 RepID=A0A0F9JEC9_9ZZZZ
MTLIPKPMTKEELASDTEIPQAHKAAIERAIYNWSLDEPEDKQWPDYYRGDQVEALRGFVLSEDDEVADDEYDDECVWFGAGWKARDRLKDSV